MVEEIQLTEFRADDEIRTSWNLVGISHPSRPHPLSYIDYAYQIYCIINIMVKSQIHCHLNTV